MAKPIDSSPNNIDQIRQLIFGEQIQDYDRRFNNLVKQMGHLSETLEQTSQEIHNKIHQAEEETVRKIDEARQAVMKDLDLRTKKIQQQLKEIQQILDELDHDKADKSLLADQLIDLATKLKGQTLLAQLETSGSDHAQQ